MSRLIFSLVLAAFHVGVQIWFKNLIIMPLAKCKS